jgi:hypothetical protein
MSTSNSKTLATLKESIDAAYKRLKAAPNPTLGTWLGWPDPVPDADGLYAGELHPREQSRIVQAMSWWAVGTGILGISHGKVAMGSGILIGSVIAASYWAKPTFGWRRNLDMTWIQILLWWHLRTAFYSPARTLYYGIVVAGALSYAASWAFMKRGDTWAAVFMHMVLTACANLSASVLYMNPLPPELFY